jgi:hypothetical protein
MDILKQLKHFMRLEDPQDVLNLLNALSIDQVTENSGTVKTAILFILFKKKVSTTVTFNDAGRAKIYNSKIAKKFYTATVKEFQQHLVNCIFNALYKDAIVLNTTEEFMAFLKSSKSEISKSFKMSGGDLIESISYDLTPP